MTTFPYGLRLGVALLLFSLAGCAAAAISFVDPVNPTPIDTGQPRTDTGEGADAGADQLVLTSVAVSPSPAGVKIGTTQVFSAQPKDQFGNPMTVALVWSSNDTNVGTISASGLFTALAQGTTTITASSGAVSGTASVTVFPALALDCTDLGSDGISNKIITVCRDNSCNCSADGTDDQIEIRLALANAVTGDTVYLSTATTYWVRDQGLRILSNGNYEGVPDGCIERGAPTCLGEIAVEARHLANSIHGEATDDGKILRELA